MIRTTVWRYSLSTNTCFSDMPFVLFITSSSFSSSDSGVVNMLVLRVTHSVDPHPLLRFIAITFECTSWYFWIIFFISFS